MEKIKKRNKPPLSHFGSKAHVFSLDSPLHSSSQPGRWQPSPRASSSFFLPRSAHSVAHCSRPSSASCCPRGPAQRCGPPWLHLGAHTPALSLLPLTASLAPLVSRHLPFIPALPFPFSLPTMAPPPTASHRRRAHMASVRNHRLPLPFHLP